MQPDTQRFKSALDDYVKGEGHDPNDPRVQSVLQPRVDEFDSWMEDKPEWVEVGNLTKASITKKRE